MKEQISNVLRNIQQLQAMCMGFQNVSMDVDMSNNYEPTITVWLFNNKEKIRLVGSYDFCQSGSKEEHKQTMSNLLSDIREIGVEV